MLSHMSLISWSSVFLNDITSSDEFKIGKLWCNKNPDSPYEVKKINELHHLRYVTFEEIDKNFFTEELEIFWLKRIRMIKNPKPEPTGIFSMVSRITYKSEIPENLLVSKVIIKNEVEKNGIEVKIYILGENLEDDLKSFFSLLKCLERKNVTFFVKPKPEVDLQ